ncbi:MAG: PEP-utilizing enzyme [Candidatus Woesearchaeota archaeon]
MNTLDKYNIKPEEWVYYGRWKQPPISDYYWLFWSNPEYCKDIGIKPVPNGYFLVDGYNVIKKEMLDIINNSFTKAIENNDYDFIENIIQKWNAFYPKHLDVAKELKTDNLLKSFKVFNKSALKVINFWFACMISDHMGELLVKKAEELGLSPIKVLESLPEKKTIMIKQARDLLKLKKLFKEKGIYQLLEKSINEGKEALRKDKELFKKVLDFIEEYEWIGTHHFWGDPYNEDKFFEDLLGVEDSVKKHDKINFPEELKIYVKYSVEIGYLRQHAAEIFNILAYKARPLFNKIAEQFNITYDDFIYMTPIEIMENLKNKSIPDINVLQKRKRKFCSIRNGDIYEVIIDEKELEDLMDTFVQKADLSLKDLKGKVASKGYAKGTVKIFIIPENMEKMKKGDILVTTMTTPDFVPLMQKAAAIVTDIGGLLSHAALISRELGKPCIVGTEIATRVLKDGDIVEVDAENGIVRRVE